MKRLPIYGLFLLSFSEAFAQSPEQHLKMTSTYKEHSISREYLYTVKQGDTLSSIVQEHRHLATGLSFIQQITNTISLNGIKNSNELYVGQEIKFEDMNSSIRTDQEVLYSIKYGDTLYGILSKFYGKKNIKTILPHILENNSVITNIDFILADSILKLPSRKLAQSLLKKNRAVASISNKEYTFKINPHVKDEIVSLSRIHARSYKQQYESLMKVHSKKELMKELKDLLELSRNLKHEYLEETFLKLITSTLKADERESHLKDLHLFLMTWKDSRIKANNTL
mgnify:CR=1 FL=1